MSPSVVAPAAAPASSACSRAPPPPFRQSRPFTRMKPRSRYIAHSSSFTHERRSSRARCSARRSRPGSYSGTSSPPSAAPRTEPRRSLSGASTRTSSGMARAMAISARASRASSTGRSRSAPRGAREEDHSLRLGRNLRVPPDELGLATATRRIGGGHRGPHALVELARETLDEPLLVLLHPGIPLREEDFTMAGFHAKELDGAPQRSG